MVQQLLQVCVVRGGGHIFFICGCGCPVPYLPPVMQLLMAALLAPALTLALPCSCSWLPCL